MARALIAIVAALLVAPALGAETLAVLAVADPPAGPDADLAELAHQLRAACRDRVGGVADVPTMRARLLGHTSGATLAELDRAYGGALAVYQNGEFESAVRTLRAIVEDLETLPESEEAYAQWTRALLRLAHAAQTVGQAQVADDALVKLLLVEPGYQPDRDQYSPAYRRRFDELRARVAALPRRRLAVVAEGRAGTVYVNGRPFGRTPATLSLPAGVYRIGGAAGAQRVPSFTVDLQQEDRTVALDFALAEAVRANAGPGLALGGGQRGHGLIRAGAWLGVDRLVVASRSFEGGAQFLVGAIYDVRRGALLREGSVRMVAGSVPSVNLGALAAFLLTGQSSREVKDRTPDGPLEIASVAAAPPPSPPQAAPPAAPERVSTVPAAPLAPPAPKPAPAAAPAPEVPPPTAAAPPSAPVLDDPLALRPERTGRSRDPVPRGPPPRWMRPAAIGTGVLALGLGALSVQQGLAASGAYGDAAAMVGPGGVLLPGSDPVRYRDLVGQGDASRRNAYVAAGSTAALAAAAGVLWWMSQGGPPALAIRF
ncbi:MAG TPA: PEGA domain-containing protein [Anaeromyxobacteraceae bacterium]|nr:PEGA domain-containing protein [Anaeromyxobacteraceae bacterium]